MILFRTYPQLLQIDNYVKVSKLRYTQGFVLIPKGIFLSVEKVEADQLCPVETYLCGVEQIIFFQKRRPRQSRK